MTAYRPAATVQNETSLLIGWTSDAPGTQSRSANPGLKGTAMYPLVRSLRIRNFKGIAELALEIDDSLTVLAGVNGVGKTSLIQAALGAVTGMYAYGTWHGGRAFEPPGALVRYGASNGTISAVIALDEGKEFEFEFAVMSTKLAPQFSEQVKAVLQARRTKELMNAETRELSTLSSTGAFEEGESRTPLAVYYDQSRIGGLAGGRWWPGGPADGRRRRFGRYFLKEKPSRAELVAEAQRSMADLTDEWPWRRERKSNRDQALDTTPHALSDFKIWFFEKEGDEAREARERGDLAYEDPEVQAVQKVMQTVAGEATRLRSRKPEGRMDRELYVRKRDGQDVPFEALSGGEQAFFLLAVDLARRLILEFPDCPVDQAPGFVCIDEIELHLHPAWQREILAKLTGLFSQCQFLVSTHSPQVLGGVAAKHIRLLTSNEDGRVEVTQPLASMGRDSNYVLEGVLETVEQDPEVDRLFGGI